MAPLRERYHISGEINSRVEDVPRALARIEERYGDARIEKLDGVSVDYEDWHGHKLDRALLSLLQRY